MGREQWFLIPKGEISPLEIRSKIEHLGVLQKSGSVQLRIDPLVLY